MNSSQFMDKQIMGLSGSQKDEFFELLKPSDDQNGAKKDEIVPSYDFQPIRPVVTGSPNADGGTRVWSSADSKPSSSRNYVSLEPGEPMKASQEREKEVYNKATISEIDRTMKKHADNLLHALESISARLTQLESRTRHLEVSVDELKVSVGNHHGSTDGKLRQLENILREISTGVQVLRDKQEIAEAHSQLAKLQLSKSESQAPDTPKSSQTEVVQHQSVAPPAPQILQAPPQILQAPPPLPLPALPPPPNAPPPPPPQQIPPPIQPAPTQIPPNPPPFYPPPPPPASQVEPPHPQYQLPPQPQEPPQPQYQLPPQLPGHPPQHYQMTPQMMHAPPPSGSPPQYPQQPPQHQPNPPSLGPSHPPPPPVPQHPEEAVAYMPSQTYPPGSRQQAVMPPPPTVPPSSQPFYGPSVYEPPPARTGSGQVPYPSGYGPPPGPNLSDSYGYSGSPSRYDGPPMKPSHPPSAPSGGSGYLRLPTAQVLPHALPTASTVGGSSSSGSGNRVPIDDVVDRVTSMGFSRDQVRATVRKLTENGQSVDLNVVLDKLMNDGEIQPQRGWFNR